MKNDNRGLTLVELLVSVAIFGIVLAAIFGFMLASAKSYNQVNDRLEIQSQSQIALNLIEDYCMNCNEGMCFVQGNNNDMGDHGKLATGTLYIINSETVSGVKKYYANVFTLYGTDNILRYARATVELNEDKYIVTIPDGDPVSEQTVGFFAKPISMSGATENGETWVTKKNSAVSDSPSQNSDKPTQIALKSNDTTLTSITVALGFIKRTATYEGVTTLALRNKPLLLNVVVEDDE